jgi:chromosome segregation ATPase
MEREAYEKAAELLRLWEQIADAERRLQEIEKERQQVYQAQQQIQGNMGALGAEGKEGALRARYVEELEASQDRLRALGQEEAGAKEEIDRLKAELQKKLK